MVPVFLVGGADHRQRRSDDRPRHHPGVAGHRRPAPRWPTSARQGAVAAAPRPRPRRQLRRRAGALRRRPRGRARARSSPCSAPTAPASRRCCRPSPASSRPTAARSSSTACDITHAPPHEIAARGVRQVPGGAGMFPPSPSRRTCASRAGCTAATGPRPGRASSGSSGLFPVLEPAARRAGRQPVRRPAAELALGMAFLVRAAAADDRRAVARPGPGHRRAAPPAARRGSRRRHHVILVEQSVNVALTVADRAYFMEKGEVRFDGPDRRAARAPRPPALGVPRGGRRADGGAARRRRPVAPAAAAAERRRRRRRRRRPGAARHRRPDRSGFGGVRAVDDVDPRGAPGEIVGIIGPNGAGKTTLFDLISGFTSAPTAARCGSAASTSPALPPTTGRAPGLGRSFQDARLFPALTVRRGDRRAPASAWSTSATRCSAALHLPRRLRLRARRSPSGSTSFELLGLGRLPLEVRPRAVDRHAPHRRPGLRARPPADGDPARRAVERHRPARDRGARPAAAPHPRRAPAPASS